MKKPAKAGSSQRAGATPSDREKVALGVARRGEGRANGPRGSTRATESTRRAAEAGAESSGGSGAQSKRGKGAGIRTSDPGGGDIGRGG